MSDGAGPGFQLQRSSGVLLHPTSLPGGRLGAEAEHFVDWLAAAGQSWWQILPLVPPDGLGSPYNSVSTFAAWPGLLADPDAAVTPGEVEDFRERHRYWIGDWERFAGAGVVADQVRFEREWSALRRYAADRGVRIIGDLPIYVARDGADVVAHRELFDWTEVAGAPPDFLNPRGQLWGNPLYRWPASRAEGYRWWIERFRRTLELVDMTRIDHFRGFVSYWAVRPDETTAEHGRWRRGPGRELFQVVERELGHLPLVVEDLGVITPAVHRLREELGTPGCGSCSSPSAAAPGASTHSRTIRCSVSSTPGPMTSIRSPPGGRTHPPPCGGGRRDRWRLPASTRRAHGA